MDEIVVSIVCITYNHEKYIRQTLDGFIMQKTNFMFDICIHDDASTDETATIIREYAEIYPDLFKTIYQTENQYSQGKSSLNTVLGIATGKYIAVCEGDDYWTDPQKLQKQVDILESHPECAGVCHNVNVVDDDGNLINGRMQKIHNISKDKIFDGRYLKNQCRFCRTASLMIRGDLFYKMSAETWLAYQNCKSNGDMKWSALVAANGKMYQIASYMACYRYVTVGNSSWNARNNGNNISLTTYTSLENIKKFIKKHYNVELSYDDYYVYLTIQSIKFYVKHRSKENYIIMKQMFAIHNSRAVLFIKICMRVVCKVFHRKF